MRKAGVEPNWRLYPRSEDLPSTASESLEALDHRRRRAKTRGKTEAEICQLYDMPRSTLAYWRKKGLVEPISDPPNVIYPPEQEHKIAELHRQRIAG